jgi:putative GTP pyrophosphokinase
MLTQEALPVESDIQFYGDYFPVLQLAEDGFIELIANLKKTYTESGRRFPVEHYKTRIKSADSTKIKLAQRGLPKTLEAAKESLFDLVGARIVCQFIDDIYELKKALEESDKVEVVKVKDYIQCPKPNGYRSLHIILHMPVQVSDGIHVQSIEIQTRTIAMDFWAALEHELKYKKNIQDAELMFSELKRCAEEIASVDLSMQAIYEWLNQ